MLTFLSLCLKKKVENAYTVSDTLNKFMNTDSNLLDEDTDDDRTIINNKFNNMNRNNKKTNSFKNVNNNNNNNNDSALYNDPEIKKLLNTIITKINTIELQLSNYNNRNIYDLILYIIIGILFSFCIYSIFAKKQK